MAPQLNEEDLEQRYHSITTLYDLAADLLSTVETAGVNPETQIAIVEPLLVEVSEATDALTEEYVNIVRLGEKKTKHKVRVETSLRRIYLALDDYTRRVQQHAHTGMTVIHNVADSIVAKIKRHVEQVVAIFMEIIDISLHLIMSKTELEQLKQHQTHINFMLHRMSQQHS